MKMRIYLTVFILFLSTCSIYCQVKVKGYYRKDGTYVQPHYRSNPDGNPYNNYSYPGNRNPYTGKVAPGNPNTYLKNYYKSGNSSNSTYYGHSQADPKKYSSRIRKSYYQAYDRYDSEDFSNYVDNLYNVKYKKLQKNQKYKITNQYGYQTGELRHSHDNYFWIYDNDQNFIGVVMLNKSGKKYWVFDQEGTLISKSKGNGGTWAWGMFIVTGLSLLYSSQL